jgi:formiminoglutamate deiminase
MTPAQQSTRYWCAQAWLPGGFEQRVAITQAGGLITAVERDSDPAPDDVRLPGVVLPGFANAHSHAFHRALRGRTHDGGGSFWTWRQAMYAVAARLDPDSYLALARAVYAEMVLAGVTHAGEFHYLHHGPGGTPYDDPNAMAQALRQAALDAGLRLTLLDTCYLAGGLTADGHTPLDGVQRRFGDGDGERWAARVAALAPSDGFSVGVAVHSVRAVPRHWLALAGECARARGGSAPLHVHLSEQPAENEACQGFYGLTPTGLLHAEGLLGPRTTAVHATHLTGQDVRLLGDTRTTACFCPTTERDLADGIGPARALHDTGSAIALGSDQHAVVDLLEEARALETHERLATLGRGRFTPHDLVRALTVNGHASLGSASGGRLEAGANADLVAIALDSVRTAGCAPGQVMMSATASDVHTVVVGGRRMVHEGRHVLGDVGHLLQESITPLWKD